DPPEWIAPRSETDWIPCASGGTRGLPGDARIECTLLDETAVLRLATAGTPDDAAPLVVVAGPETAPDDLAARLASAAPGLTASRPLVIVDHKGRTGPAGSCLPVEARRTLDGLAE